MIKKIALGFGLAAILAAGAGLFVYFDKLRIEGDALLTACWAVDIIDDVTGEKVVGAEDLDFDPATGTIFLSAYDRRAVDREIEEGKVTTQGGIYTISLSDIHQTGVLPVHDISRDFKEAGNEFRPHGFDVSRYGGENRVFVINRLYPEALEGEMVPVIEIFQGFERQTSHSTTLNMSNWLSYEGKQVCDPYDVYFSGRSLTITNYSKSCEQVDENVEFDEVHGFYFVESEDFGVKIVSGNVLPNGVTGIEDFYSAIAVTLEKEIFIEGSENRIGLFKVIDLEIAPDNLTLDGNRNLYVAGFPNLLDYYFYMSELFGVEKSPSVAYRIAPESYEQTLLFKDDGALISGATVALRAGDYLIMGSAWDDNIAICSGMDALDG